MSDREYTHRAFIPRDSGDCLIDYDGALGAGTATNEKGETRTWTAEENEDGQQIGKSLRWFRGALIEDHKTQTAPKAKAKNKGK